MPKDIQQYSAHAIHKKCRKHQWIPLHRDSAAPLSRLEAGQDKCPGQQDTADDLRRGHHLVIPDAAHGDGHNNTGIDDDAGQRHGTTFQTGRVGHGCDIEACAVAQRQSPAAGIQLQPKARQDKIGHRRRKDIHGLEQAKIHNAFLQSGLIHPY